MTAEHTLSAIIRTHSLEEGLSFSAWKEDSHRGQTLPNAIMQELTLAGKAETLTSDARTFLLHPGRRLILGPMQRNLCHVLVFGRPGVTVNGLTWLLTCASLSQAEVSGHGN